MSKKVYSERNGDLINNLHEINSFFRNKIDLKPLVRWGKFVLCLNEQTSLNPRRYYDLNNNWILRQA